MADLRVAFESMGFADVATYIASGNVLAVFEGAPRGFGGDSHLCDVVFVRKPLTVEKAFGLVEIREGVDRAWPARGVVYFSRLAAKATSSRLNKIASQPEYKNMTLRSWSTTTKLLALMESN